MSTSFPLNPSEEKFRALIRWGLYPFSWTILIIAFSLILHEIFPAKIVWGASIGFLAVIYLLIEWRFPYEKRWAMTFASFKADLKFIILNSALISGLSATLALFTISLSANNTGPATNWPIYLQVIAALLIFEASNYVLHRAMHETKGAMGKFLWRMHAAHHLPPRLYILMHAVAHPINGVIIQALAIIIPVWLMGYTQTGVTMFLLINGMHGLISHFNADVRMAWANYLFVGPELHRYHHSADVDESKNYGATLSIYDQLFGTFVYFPGTPPKQLGVASSEGFPAYEKFFAVLKLPFASQTLRQKPDIAINEE